MAGKILAVGVPLITLLISWGLLWILYRIHPLLGFVAELLLASLTLAAKSLKTESMKVYAELQKGDLEGARHAVSMIVGRDTEVLDQTGVTKAAVETVAENTSDGVIAPMLYMAIGGAPLAMCYKAVNTLDSMVDIKTKGTLISAALRPTGRPGQLDSGQNFRVADGAVRLVKRAGRQGSVL